MDCEIKCEGDACLGLGMETHHDERERETMSMGRYVEEATWFVKLPGQWPGDHAHDAAMTTLSHADCASWLSGW